VTADAPTHEQLLPLVEAVSSIADHAGLRPWRLIELRGDARERLGAAFVAASGLDAGSTEAMKLAGKPLRAPLLLAIVAIHRPSFKVAEWEQDAVASGVGHLLSLLLDEAGWGVMWRTGGHTRARQVAEMHELAEHEKLMGWLYVGGVPETTKPERRTFVDPGSVLSAL
jgi:nitroreductase